MPKSSKSELISIFSNMIGRIFGTRLFRNLRLRVSDISKYLFANELESFLHSLGHFCRAKVKNKRSYRLGETLNNPTNHENTSSRVFNVKICFDCPVEQNDAAAILEQPNSNMFNRKAPHT